MKHVEIVLRRGWRESNGGDKSKIYCKHINKYYNVSPVQLLYANRFLKTSNAKCGC
jgi:hypothetical protein